MKKIISLLLTLVMVLSLVACGGGKEETPSGGGASAPSGDSAATEESTTPSVLRVARGEDLTTWDSYDTTSIQNKILDKLLYNMLVKLSADGEVEADLATEWAPNEDATEWTFKLREGVQYTDGTPFNAEAVKVSLERFQNETLSLGGMWSTLETVEIVNDYEVVLKFSSPNGAVLNNLTELPILNPVVFKAEGVEGLAKAIGTGPYTLENWEIASKTVLKRNESYWGELPPYETIEFYVITEESTRLAAVQTGDVDIADQIPTDLLITVEGDDSVQIHRIGVQDNHFMGFKCDEAPFDDINARLAVHYAINRQSIVDNVELGGAVPQNFFPKGTLGYNESVPAHKYDPELAKEYLAKSDYNGEPIVYIAPIGWYPKQSEMCQAIIADLEAVGFNVELQLIEGSTFSAARAAGEYDIYTTGCAHSSNDPNMFLEQRVTGDSGKSGYVNAELNELIAKGSAAVTLEERQAIYEQVAAKMEEVVAPQIALFTWERIYVTNSNIDLDASAKAFRSDARMDLRYVVFK